MYVDLEICFHYLLVIKKTRTILKDFKGHKLDSCQSFSTVFLLSYLVFFIHFLIYLS